MESYGILEKLVVRAQQNSKVLEQATVKNPYVEELIKECESLTARLRNERLKS